MKLLMFLLILIMSILFSLGCETTNPLCTKNYCIEGEIYAKSELADDAEYGELPIDDAVIFATLAGTPIPVKEIEPPNIISVQPRNGAEIRPNATIHVIFDSAPTDFEVSFGNVTISGSNVTVSGPFTLVL